MSEAAEYHLVAFECIALLEELQNCPIVETLLPAVQIQIREIMPQTIFGLYGVTYNPPPNTKG